jgi:flotillin
MPGLFGTVTLAAAFLVFMLLIIAYALAKRYVKVGPHQALVISGRGSRIEGLDGSREKIGYRIVKGGGTFVWPIIEKYEILSLELSTLDVQLKEVYTAPGVPLDVDGVAQVKVKGDDISIRTAAERFLSKGQKDTMTIALQTVEGHLRAIVGQMTVEDIYRNRDAFSQKVQEVAASDMANMGLVIDSFTLRDIKDSHGYLEALGKPRTAQVKRDAVIAQAEADRDATIKSAEARQAGEEAKFKAETKIAEADRDYQINKAQYDGASNRQKAEADLAYDLQKYKTQQLVTKEEVQVQVVEKEQSISVQEKEIVRKERELEAGIEKPAEAEKYRVQTIAEAEQFRLTAEAKGRAEAEKARGFAEADVTRAVGQADADAQKARGLAEADVVLAQGTAEAEAMAKKADSWAKYNEAAILQMFMEVLPQIAENIAKPLSQIERMVVINSGDSGGGASKITGDVTQVIAQLPPVVEALSGMNLKELIERVPGLGEKLAQAKETKKKPDA